jgi:hypothetical protein
MISCHNCIFWRRGLGINSGQCHKNPPIVVGISNDRGVITPKTLWPTTQDLDFCSYAEFKG